MGETSGWQGARLIRNTIFREVYKNAWLRMLILDSKKKDKLWIVFCVHDDTDAYLEAYMDNKLAATHNPHWYMSLNNTIHVTPSICPQDEEYEFVITLQTDVIRLSAPTWQLMTDWVETLRRKLLEMKILTPKENVYSKLPENKTINLLPTRDPTSPLPPPPPVPTVLVPGVEPVQVTQVFFPEGESSSTSTNGSTLSQGTAALSHYEHLCAERKNTMAARRPHRSASNCDNRHRLQIRVMDNTEGMLEQSPSIPSGVDQRAIMLAGEDGLRRRRNSLSDSHSLTSTSSSAARILPTSLTLRMQQVLQLRKEMAHPAGMRLRLKRRDCTSSMALVDMLDSVWVAGWKQKECPMLYNALHIGDALVSVQGVAVHRAVDARRLLSIPGLQVDLVIRRLPFGQVFAIRREVEGQPLGIMQEDGSAVIMDVLSDGLAAKYGLSNKAKTCDGLSLTNWVLTEINGRPLNLFFKDNEIRERLNSVGRDISILVQPLDLIKHLKKQLKLLRNYKEYVLQ